MCTLTLIQTLTQHVSGSRKDSSDNEDQRVKGRVSLGELVDLGSGLSGLRGRSETSGLGLVRQSIGAKERELSVTIEQVSMSEVSLQHRAWEEEKPLCSV
jgi:hypothetical protein